MFENFQGHRQPRQVYLFCYRMGGYGSWRYGISHGDRVAAMIAIEDDFIRNSRLVSEFYFKHFKDPPVWSFHNCDADVMPFDKEKCRSIPPGPPVDLRNPPFTNPDSTRYR